MEAACLRGCERQLESGGSSTRAGHCAGSWRGAMIIRSADGDRVLHLNRHHQILKEEAAQRGAAPNNLDNGAAGTALTLREEEFLLRVRRDRKPLPFGFVVLLVAIGGAIYLILHKYKVV